ncbi:MAG: gamma carbonic anhydrase family protein [Maricaulis sp.]|jgi:carbonic anhydrase/acetyltransferase-like protein (isoleucine patch superfamily)|nr:gamma carbonic anhydrase family protein [Maricaulis sp.]MDG2044189.1 gamma carbonic anhydrase family protein [Maricaulis sp.]
MTLYALAECEPDVPEDGAFWVAPDARVIGNVVLRRNASIWYSAVVRGDNDPIEIGEDSNVQDGSILHTDEGFPLTIGKGVTIGHRAMLHGCDIGDYSLIGIGATILNGATIGRNCIIGAHALITEGKEIPDNSMVVGAPGKVIKTLDATMYELLKASADHYVANWKRHKYDLRALD